MWHRCCAVALVASCVPLTAVRGAEFPVGIQPRGLAFDGQNIWVGNFGSWTLTKLRASDGAVLGTFPALAPDGMTFDGANVWWGSQYCDIPCVGGFVGKTRASDGAQVGEAYVAFPPLGLAFDGTHVWAVVANTVTKIRASDGVDVGFFPVGLSAADVVFDGANVWVTAWGPSTVTKLRASDGMHLGAFPVGSAPRGVAFDGTNVWVTNSYSDTVTKLRASDGANLGTFFAGDGPTGVIVNGPNVFVTNSNVNTVTVLRASDGGHYGGVAVGNAPIGILFDGSSFWVANSGSNSVSKIEYPLAFLYFPAATDTFAVGQTLTLTGYGVDATGQLPPTSLSWTVVLRDGPTTHPVLGPITGNDIPFVAPPPESLAAAATSQLEIQLTVSQGGRSTTVTRVLQPRKVDVTFATTPPGLSVDVNGSTLVGPQSVTSWEGYSLRAAAPPWQQLGPDLHVFSSWSVGPANPVTIVTPSAPATYTASYQLSTDSGPLGYYTITPCRLVDTRGPMGPWGGPALLAGATRDFVSWGACGIPTTAKALAVNLAVTGPDGPGHLRIFPSDGQATGTSTAALAFGTGQTRGSNTMVRLGANNGGFSVFNGMLSGSTHFILDVFGYFE